MLILRQRTNLCHLWTGGPYIAINHNYEKDIENAAPEDHRPLGHRFQCPGHSFSLYGPTLLVR